LVRGVTKSVADFALTPDAQGVLQGVVSRAFVETNLSAALHVSIEQPVDDEERTLNATDFAQSQGQLVLARVGRKFLQQLTGWHDARCHLRTGFNIRSFLLTADR
jgi:hypothetical protein